MGRPSLFVMRRPLAGIPPPLRITIKLSLGYNIHTMESISPALGALIMMNNYFHDVATGLLLASSFALWMIIRHYGEAESRGAKEYFLGIYDSMTRVARLSFWWIIIAGFPRTYFYREFEWANSVDYLQVPAIILKHVLVFAFVGTGLYMWHRFNRRVKDVRRFLSQPDVAA